MLAERWAAALVAAGQSRYFRFCRPMLVTDLILVQKDFPPDLKPSAKNWRLASLTWYLN